MTLAVRRRSDSRSWMRQRAAHATAVLTAAFGNRTVPTPADTDKIREPPQRDIADDHAGETLRSLQRILEVQASNPELQIVPAHDASVHDRIGYFPERWLP